MEKQMRVAIIAQNSTEYISTIIDIWNAGDCAVLVDWQTPIHSIVSIILEAGVSKCYIQKGIYKDILKQLTPVEYILFDTSNTIGFLPNYIYEKYKENYSKDEALVLYSSGTTGKSKGVILSHYAISTNADAIIKYMNISKSIDIIMVIKPFSHSSTITGEILVSLKTNVKLVVSTLPPLPRIILRTIGMFGITTICINPTILSLLVDEYSKGNHKLPSLKQIYVSGSILGDYLYNKAHKLLNVHIFNVYGLTEAAPRVCAQRINCCKSNSVGRPIDGVEIAIVDDTGKQLGYNESGIIHINSPSIFNGYVVGEVKYISLYNGWLNSGDIGYLDNNDELHIVGRIDEIIVCNSHIIYPNDIENRILSHKLIDDCCICCFKNKEIDTIVCLYTSHFDCNSIIINSLKKTLIKYEMPQRIIRVNQIPRNSNGKIDRKKVLAFLQKDLIYEEQ